MKRVLKHLAAIPVPAIMFVLALGLFLWGAYVVSPWYIGTAPVNYTFDHQRTYEIVLGAVYMVLGGARLYGVAFKRAWLAEIGPTLVMMGYLFLALLRIVVVGWTPVSWLPLLLLAIVAAICRLALSVGRE